MKRSQVMAFLKGAVLVMCLVGLAACGKTQAATPASSSAGETQNTNSADPGSTAPTPVPTKENKRPDDILVFEGANVERESEGVLEYRVARPLNEIVEFYQTELPQLGWEPAGNPNIMPIVASMVYRKDKQNLSINMQFNEKAQSTLVRLFWQGY